LAAALRFHLQEQLLPITETLPVLPSLSQQLSQVEEAAQYQLRTVTEEVTRVKVTLEQQTMALPKLAERIVSQDAPSHHQLPAPSGRKSRRVKRAESVEAKRPPADFDKGGFVYECLRADPTISIGAIQRKAAQIGQTISVGYISERRKAFFDERFPKGVNTETVETTEE
jgi:hypothetical protein